MPGATDEYICAAVRDFLKISVLLTKHIRFPSRPGNACELYRGIPVQHFFTPLSRTACMLVSLTGVLVAGVAAAHHSAAGYDFSRTESSQATIKEFRWGAPHSSIVITIKGANGRPEDIALASAAPTTFVRQGFKPKDFHIGDKIEIAWHPTKNGNPGGILETMKLGDGRVFKETEFSSQAASPQLNQTRSKAPEKAGAAPGQGPEPAPGQ